jgi:hypothetical protein
VVDFRERLIKELADAEAKRICRRVILTLQKMKDCLLSGDDTELGNVWDEVCVQVQYEESYYWDSYVETVERVIATQVERTPTRIKQALWLQTDAALDWLLDHEDDKESPPYNVDDITNYLLHEYVLLEAGRWSNKKILAFIERSAMRD